MEREVERGASNSGIFGANNAQSGHDTRATIRRSPKPPPPAIRTIRLRENEHFMRHPRAGHCSPEYKNFNLY